MSKPLYFNLDLTLTEMDKSFDECFVEALRGLGVSGEDIDSDLYSDLFFDHFRDLNENPRREAMIEYSERRDLDIDSEKVVQKYCTEELDSIKPVENLKEKLEQLFGSFNLGIITAGTTELQMDKLEKLGIEEFFDEVLITYEEDKSKMELLREVEEKYDETPIYFSNSESDIQEAKEAGLKTAYMDLEGLGDSPVEEIGGVTR